MRSCAQALREALERSNLSGSCAHRVSKYSCALLVRVLVRALVRALAHGSCARKLTFI